MATRLLIFWLLVLLLPGNGHAQKVISDTLLQRFDHYRNNVVHEKIYAHTDRNYYLTGETIWFKLYTVDGTLHKPFDLSKVAYLEILDKENTPVVQIKVGLKEGTGHGAIFLPATLSSGHYTLRVYTQWMKNFDAAFFFHKKLTIVNPFISPETVQGNYPENHHIDFFPEGGHLVAGLTTKVAFKAANYQGIGIACRGAIINQNNDTSAVFSSGRFGIGTFLFAPSAQQQYRVVVRDSTGKITTHALPEVQPEGYGMTLQRHNEKNMHVVVRYQGAAPSRVVYCLVHSRQRIAYTDYRILDPRETIFTIDGEKLPEGISHITLFDENLKPLCERLYFKRPQNRLTINATPESKETGIRRKVNVNIHTASSSGNAVKANLSVAVYKVDSLTTVPASGIHEYLQLTSDLKGTIESPEYYLREDTPPEAWDNLMLTHGWRRFDWQHILHNKTALTYIPEYNGHIITGRVLHLNGSPAPAVMTYLSTPGRTVRLYTSRSRADGKIYFEVKDYTGQQPVIVQTNIRKDSVYRIELHGPFATTFAPQHPLLFSVNARKNESLLARSVAMQVESIYHDEQRDKPASADADTISFYGRADRSYYLDAYTRFPVMEEVMREYVAPVFVRKRKDGFHFLVLDQLNNRILSGDPMVLLDGVPVFDVNKIMAFNPLQVKKLDVVTREFYLGGIALSGIVSYQTYQGDLGTFALDPRSIRIDYDGLQQQRIYYTPRYETQKQRNDRTPDQRYLLTWLPEVKTDATGNTQIDFYTADVTGTFCITVEGLTSDGSAGTRHAFFTVKRQEF